MAYVIDALHPSGTFGVVSAAFWLSVDSGFPFLLQLDYRHRP
jgi:hypothetical protein